MPFSACPGSTCTISRHKPCCCIAIIRQVGRGSDCRATRAAAHQGGDDVVLGGACQDSICTADCRATADGTQAEALLGPGQITTCTADGWQNLPEPAARQSEPGHTKPPKVHVPIDLAADPITVTMPDAPCRHFPHISRRRPSRAAPNFEAGPGGPYRRRWRSLNCSRSSTWSALYQRSRPCLATGMRFCPRRTTNRLSNHTESGSA